MSSVVLVRAEKAGSSLGTILKTRLPPRSPSFFLFLSPFSPPRSVPSSLRFPLFLARPARIGKTMMKNRPCRQRCRDMSHALWLRTPLDRLSRCSSNPDGVLRQIFIDVSSSEQLETRRTSAKNRQSRTGIESINAIVCVIKLAACRTVVKYVYCASKSANGQSLESRLRGDHRFLSAAFLHASGSL